MKKIRDEDLILYYYGEAPAASTIRRQLATSAELRERYEAMRRTLDAIDEPAMPGRAEAYGARIWHRLEPRLETGRADWTSRWWRPSRRWGWAAAVLVLLVAAFLAGRLAPRAGEVARAGLPADGRERILLMSVAGHLERSEVLLLELVNTQENGEVDLSVERQMATELGRESRLYRLAAQQAGKADIAALLEQLETVLLEISHAPESMPSADLGALRVWLADGDVLFKVRVLGSRLRQEVMVESRTESSGPGARDI